MDTLLIFFAFPIAVIIVSAILEKILRNPVAVAALIFAIFLVVTFAVFDETFLIATFALSGFANFTSVAIQISGIGEIAPNQRKNLARMGIRALIAGTLTSYISACMAAMLL